MEYIRVLFINLWAADHSTCCKRLDFLTGQMRVLCAENKQLLEEMHKKPEAQVSYHGLLEEIEECKQRITLLRVENERLSREIELLRQETEKTSVTKSKKVTFEDEQDRREREELEKGPIRAYGKKLDQGVAVAAAGILNRNPPNPYEWVVELFKLQSSRDRLFSEILHGKDLRELCASFQENLDAIQIMMPRENIVLLVAVRERLSTLCANVSGQMLGMQQIDPYWNPFEESYNELLNCAASFRVDRR